MSGLRVVRAVAVTDPESVPCNGPETIVKARASPSKPPAVSARPSGAFFSVVTDRASATGTLFEVGAPIVMATTVTVLSDDRRDQGNVVGAQAIQGAGL